MDRSRISDEWVMGATVGGYLVLTFVLNFWGFAFIHYWCGNSPSPLSTRSGGFSVYLVFLIPGTLVGVLDWAQSKLDQTHTGLVNHLAVRVALWMNLFAIVGFLVGIVSNYGPDRDISFFAIAGFLAMALWPLGLVVSLGNLTWASIQWAKSPRSRNS